MKKTFLISFFGLLLLTGCSDSTGPIRNEITIHSPGFNDSEYEIIQASGVDGIMSFVMDIPKNLKSEEIEYWIDHYQDGQLKDQAIGLKANLIEGVREIKLYFSTWELEAEENWSLYVLQNSTQGSVTSGAKRMVQTDEGTSGKFMATGEGEVIKEGVAIDIGMLTPLEEGTPEATTDILQSIQSHKNVYVLRVKLN